MILEDWKVRQSATSLPLVIRIPQFSSEVRTGSLLRRRVFGLRLLRRVCVPSAACDVMPCAACDVIPSAACDVLVVCGLASDATGVRFWAIWSQHGRRRSCETNSSARRGSTSSPATRLAPTGL